MAMIRVTSVEGRPTVSKTITIVTSPAWGIPAAPILAAVAVILKFKKKRLKFYVICFLRILVIKISHLIAAKFPRLNTFPRTWAIKIAATAS